MGFIVGFVLQGIFAVVILNQPVGKTVFDIDKLPAGETHSRWVYTFPSTYSELKPLAKDILSDDFISFREGVIFSDAIDQIQHHRKKIRTNQRIKEQWWKK
jgi:hypothetical protein